MTVFLEGELPDISLPPEKQIEIRKFTDIEKMALIIDGALVYVLTGQTLSGQKNNQEQKGKPSFRYITNESEGLILRPSLLSEVAIYPDPEEFFVPNSGGKNVADQDKLAKKDAKSLRKRLRLPEIDVIIPEAASTLTELTFQHLDQTNNWLFGREYALVHGVDDISGITKNPTDLFGSCVADVGGAGFSDGLRVYAWYRGLGHDGIWAVRLVVPKGVR